VDLWDVDFLTVNDGWLTSRHMIYRTTSGGTSTTAWEEMTFFDGTTLLGAAELAELNFYSLDVVHYEPSPSRDSLPSPSRS
jgi:hypothetical protein